MIILFFLAVFLFCGLIALGESHYERDWPRTTGKFALIAGLLFLFSLSAFGQNVRFDLPVYTVQAQGGNLLPVYAIPGAGVKFYSCSGATCTTLATTYISATSTTSCPTSPTPMQVTLNGSSTCVSSADPYGNMGGWFLPGQYMATITAGAASYNYFFTIAIGGGSGVLPIVNGGTGATTAPTALTNLGALPLAGGTMSGSLTAPSINNIINASSCGLASKPSWCSGTDIGAWINAAFQQCAGVSGTPNQSCTVKLSPSLSYSQSTTISIPNSISAPYIIAPILDCSGDTLVYSGTAQAVIVHGENGGGPFTTGAIRNCNISGSTTDGGASAIVQQNGRLGFAYLHNTFSDATSCLDIENTNTDGGPGYTEQTTVDGLSTSGCLSHIKLHTGTGATSSFEYDVYKNWHCQLGTNEKCFDAGELGTVAFDTQGMYLQMHVNTASSTGPGYVIWEDNSNSVNRGVINMTGENTDGMTNFYTTYLNSNGSAFYNQGNISVNGVSLVGFASGVNHTNYVLHPSMTYTANALNPTGTSTVSFEPELGVIAQRHCKTIIGGGAKNGSFTYWMASNGGVEDDCGFALIGRNTSNTAGDQDVDIQGTGGAAFTNIFYASSLSKTVGIGPGYGNGTFPAGSITPPYQLSVAGSFGATTGSFSGAVSAGSIALASDTAQTSTARSYPSWHISSTLSSINKPYGPIAYSTKGGYIEAITANVEGALTCTTYPTVAIYDCGASVAGCAPGTSLTSLATTGAGQFGTIGLNVPIAPGHFFTAELTAGTCTAQPTIDIGATVRQY